MSIVHLKIIISKKDEYLSIIIQTENQYVFLIVAWNKKAKSLFDLAKEKIEAINCIEKIGLQIKNLPKNSWRNG